MVRQTYQLLSGYILFLLQYYSTVHVLFLFCCLNLLFTFLFVHTCRDKLQPQSRVSLRDLQTKSSSNPKPGLASATGSTSNVTTHLEQTSDLPVYAPSISTSERGLSPAADPHDSTALSDITVPLEAIKPSKQTILDAMS